MEPRLIERCQGCLWNLGVTDANKKFIIESGAPFYVVGNMIEYKHSEGILSSGAGVLSSLIPDARLMKDLLGSDVLQTLQQAVTEFPRNPVLSSKGSQLIAALMENGLRTRSATTNAPVSPTSPLVDQQQRMRSTSGSAVTNTTNSGSTYIQASSFATIRSNAGLDGEKI